MALQRHPIDSFDKKLNFWQEFPDFKINRIFGPLWNANRKADKLKESSLLMWALALCYDRKSNFFPQPEQDKWEVVSEDLFGDSQFLFKLATEEEQGIVIIPMGVTLYDYISAFEEAIDTPLGISLRNLERKLAERTAFINQTQYSLDYYQETDGGRQILKKGTADQLDRMFRDTGKINEMIKKAMDDLKLSDGLGSAKGGGAESLGDGDKTF